jgi:hypothetical protein
MKGFRQKLFTLKCPNVWCEDSAGIRPNIITFY